MFHAVLAEATAAFPAVFEAAQFPRDAKRFKARYGSALARFEAARVNAEQRVEIARFVARRTQESLFYRSGTSHVPLGDHLRSRGRQIALTRTRLMGSPGLCAEVPFEGKVLRGQEVQALVDRLHDAQQLTDAAHTALSSMLERCRDAGGKLDLRGQRFALLGAGAELSPARLLLRAGASVLWIDLADPARALAGEDGLAGSIFRASEAQNLLEQPREVASAIEQFAADGPVHIGMFAYAGGASQEWRLGAAMNAIVASLDPALIRSVALLVSPTTPSVLTPETRAAESARLARAPAWQRTLAALGVIQGPGHHAAHDRAVALATVALQGLSYQAAQYISKIAAAESYAVYGTQLDTDEQRPIPVSANVAGITRTRSLSHPLFEAAFAGAHHFGVRIFDAATTRALSGLLMLHDILPLAPLPMVSPRARAEALHARQIHGGIYGLPFVLEGVIRSAALLGMASRPSVLWSARKPRADLLPLTLPAEEPVAAPARAARAEPQMEAP
ncbi:MAG TPA: hypothetical protein VFZ61_02100 [Polyangiales bacterium]